LNIAYQVALAVQYLHEEAKPPILHRDVKSANVLLVDDNFAKLADFGLSKLGPKNNQFTITDVRGSYGFMDPQ
jgi:serine/threonine protein kinase